MDRSSSHSSGESVSTTTSGAALSTTSGSGSNNFSSRDHYLKNLNKISHKISKPQSHSINTAAFLKRQPTFDHQRPKLETSAQQAQVVTPPSNLQQQQQTQPPVYNINKNDFRDVVQRLTGSPAHERFSIPPPINPPKPQSSRLQRIRPPPLAQISNRPPAPALAQISNRPPLLSGLSDPNLIPSANLAPPGPIASGFVLGQRPVQPLSPLPPFPVVHAAAESPVSAYMRYLQGSISTAEFDPRRLSGTFPLAPLVSPRWNSLSQAQLPLQQQVQHLPNARPPLASASGTYPQFPVNPSSPLPFGCLSSPRSAYPLLSPRLLFSPTTQLGFQQLPLSPTLPVPSPKWKGF